MFTRGTLPELQILPLKVNKPPGIAFVGGHCLVTVIAGAGQITQVAVLVAEKTGLPKTPDATPETVRVSGNGPQRFPVGV